MLLKLHIVVVGLVASRWLAIKYPAMSIHDSARVCMCVSVLSVHKCVHVYVKQMPFIQIALWYRKFDFPYYSIGIFIYI